MGADKKIIEGILFLIAGLLVTGAAGSMQRDAILLMMGIILIAGGIAIIIHYLKEI